jgi:hypothetical protein
MFVAVYGQNMSLNLDENIDQVVIEPIACGTALKTVFFVRLSSD